MSVKLRAGVHLADIETAINWWLERSPSTDGITACAEVRALAEPYVLMGYEHENLIDEMSDAAFEAWMVWYAQTPDTPCIAICSTAQGDPLCKGCGRTEQEVQDWPLLDPVYKRSIWHRITTENTAWRFNRYAERATRG